MKKVCCNQFGPPENLQRIEVDTPVPQAGEALISISAAGVGFVDGLMVQGLYQVKPPLPYYPGSEFAGMVSAVGESVTHVKPGDRVLGMATNGAYADSVSAVASSLVKLPANLADAIAAGFYINYATALYGLRDCGDLKAGETLLILGAAGGVGLAAVDLGKLFGARVIGTAGSEEKRGVVTALGADHVIDSNEDFREEVQQLTGGLGADVIYDPVGGDVFDQSMRCIAPFGRILIVGFTSGRPALAKTNHLLVKDASVIGYTIGGLQRHKPALAERNSTTLMGWLASGRIKPFISHRLPMEDIVEAYQLLVDRKVAGKVILTSDQDEPAD